MVRLTRRAVLQTSFAATAAAAFGWRAITQEVQPPIIFVHGDGDDAEIWYTVLWRFESNGYDPRRLIAIDFPNPGTGRPGNYGQPHPGRSTTGEQLIELAARVEEVRRSISQDKVVLVAHSRGGNAVRNYIKNGGGHATVTAAVLCACPNHGTYASRAPEFRLGETNGWGHFLRQLNEGPTEATPGVRFLTIRSDRNDRWFQPALPPDHPVAGGRTGVPSNAVYDSPELTGATNLVLPGADHKEAARSPRAFEAMYRFILEREPAHLDILPEARPILDGKVTGLVGNLPTNLPLEGAEVEIFAVSPDTGERLGGAAHRRVTGADGRWGPFEADPAAYHEFVLAAPGYPVEHIYRPPFPRSSTVLRLRPRGFAQDSDAQAPGAVITVVRCNGNLARDRDNVLVDGQVPSGLPGSPPQRNETTLRLDAQDRRPVPVAVNGEHLTVQTWPARDNHVVVAEVHY
ncbi:alpha/beta fold hydrolase [Microvirga massiliensis]|uniref:alpha/beta fold hydrolase n=1 Tax=Microvirga massiliensis TaxID=1033741 RepID=UPI00062BD7CF|nr:alpha/beta fold hydrolase [Microvirga massiliensis]